MMDWMPIVSGLILAGAVGLGAIIYRVFTRGIKTYLHEEIRSQLVPNGGNSLADRVDRLETAVSKLTKTLEETECLPGCPARCEHPPTVTRA